MAIQTLERHRPNDHLPGVTVDGFRWKINGQATGSPVATFSASQNAGIFSLLTDHSCHATSPIGSPFVVQSRHGDRELIPTPDEVAICIPKVAICAKTATHLLCFSDWPNLGGKLQEGPLEGPKW